MTNCKQHAAQRGIHEVLTDDKDYFKVMADAPLNLENGTASAMPRIVREDIRGNPQSCTSTYVRKEQSDSENTGACRKVKRKHMEHIGKKVVWEAFAMAWYMNQFLFTKL